MTKLNHERAKLRLIDENRKRRSKELLILDETSTNDAIEGFVDLQDLMGSALSELHTQSPDFVVNLSEHFDGAFTHNDLSIFNRLVDETRNPDERSIVMRIVAGLLESHKFSREDGQFQLKRYGKLKWRSIGVWALYNNLRGYRLPNGRPLGFSEGLQKKMSTLT